MSKLRQVRVWFVIAAVSYVAVLALGFSGIVGDKLFAVLNRFLTGALVSFLFYYLVVSLPEARRRRKVSQNLLNNYRSLKRELATQLIFASQKGGRRGIQADDATISKILTPDGFEELFRRGREANEGMYAVQNGLDSSPSIYKEMRRNVHVFTHQLRTALSAVEVESAELYMQLQRFESFLTRYTLDGEYYGSDRMLLRLIQDMFSGWDLVDGQHNTDRMEVLLQKL